MIAFSAGGVATTGAIFGEPGRVYAYEADPDPLRESLYLMSRVQEATLQQERLVKRSTEQEVLQRKMKLSLKLIEKSYRLQDQINFASQYIQPPDALVETTAYGNQAVADLQSAIDFVKSDLKTGALTSDQKSFLLECLTSTRESLFLFLDTMPPEKLAKARARVEDENKLNIEEFDLDSDAAIFNPVPLPWKERIKKV